MRYRIVSVKNPPYVASCDELYSMLGLSKAKLPDEGIEPKIIQGIKVWVVPKATKAQFVRTMCECPGCKRVLTVKCLAQHKCK